MRSTYEVLTEYFCQDEIEEMVLQYEAMQIHGQYIPDGLFRRFEERLSIEGFHYQIHSKALTCIAQYVLIKYSELIKKKRSIPKDMTEITLQIPKEDLARIKEPRPMSIGYQVSSFKEYPDFNDKENHHQDALKYKKED